MEIIRLIWKNVVKLSDGISKIKVLLISNNPLEDLTSHIEFQSQMLSKESSE